MDIKNLGIGSKVQHNQFGIGVVFDIDSASYHILFVSHGEKELSKQHVELKVLTQPAEPDNTLSLEEVESALRKVVKQLLPASEEKVDLGKKWQNGTLIFKPADSNMQAKEMPIEAFFHKIVMVRDKLRVLEQNINSNAVLTDEEKVNLQQYISRCYGSLTSFNVLFADKDQQFSSK